MLKAGSANKLVRHLGTAQACRVPHRPPRVAYLANRVSCRCTEGSVTSAPSEDHPLIKWLLEKGGTVRNLAVSECFAEDGSSMGLGLVATADAAPGDILVEVPHACHLTYGPGHSSEALQWLVDVTPVSSKLIPQILSERARGSASPFATYIEYLPKDPPDMPLFFSDELLTELQSPETEAAVLQDKEFAAYTADVAIPVLRSECDASDDPFCGEPVTADDVAWALSMEKSRSFGMSEGDNDCFLPMLDIANYDNLAPNMDFVPRTHPDAPPDARHGSRLVAIRDVAVGEQLMWSYGFRTNRDLLTNYGFFFDGNPNDRLAFPFDLQELADGAALAGEEWPAEDLKQWQLEQVGGLGLLGGPGSLPNVFFGGPTHLEIRLVAATLALSATERSQISDWETGVSTLDGPSLAQNADIGRKALRVLGGVVQFKLNAYSTTLEEDRALLDGGGLSSGVQRAIRFRMGNKRILHDAADFITNCLGS